LNGPLLGCLLLAVHHCFPSRKKNHRSLIPFGTGVAVDMRSRLPQSPLTPQTIGFCISGCGIKLNRQFPLATTPFWTLAKKCMRSTNKAIARGDTNFAAHFYDYITSNERKFAQFSRFYPNGLLSELFFSNNGKYPFPCDYNHGQLRLRGLHFINNSSVYYSTAAFYVTCAGDGQLDFSLSHVMESEEKA
jgi:hypothetical protein